jgi:2-desacetyl-2-hydroxyethyl bacteriochlorophyllide A dehydrogenase
MKAALFKAPGDLSVTQLPQPELSFGDALVRVRYGGICGTDMHVFQGHHKAAKFPLVPGHEFVGTLVEAYGELGGGLILGNDALVQPYYACGTCSLCISGRDNICSRLSVLGVHRDGCFAEYVTVPIKKVFKLPEGLDYQLAALTEPLSVAVHDVRMSGLKVGQTAFVFGSGPIGMLIALVARLAGATKVVISEVNAFRILFAEQLGFSVINPMTTNLLDTAAALTDGHGFDVVYEASGTRQGAEAMTQLVKIGGKIIVIGFPAEKYPIDTAAITAKEIAIQGARIHAQINFMEAIGVLASGVLNDDLYKFIDRVYILDDFGEAMRYAIEDQEHFKVLVEVNE